MSNMCSRHRHHEPGCRLCDLRPEDVFPNWAEKVAESEAAGQETCGGCGFVYYRVIDACPMCQYPRGKTP